MMTASRRATATQARLWPRFLASFRPQAFATYTNSCEADKAGSTILHDGKCQGPGRARCPRNNLRPVCARTIKTQVEKTYDNLCWAEKD
jgi:hypothetical protein